MQVASLILQLVGVLVTGVGMIAAWYAARDGLTVREWVQRRRSRGKAQVVEVGGPATATASVFPPTISVTYEHDPSLPLEDQVERLAMTVRSLRGSDGARRDEIRDLRRELSEVSSQLVDLDAESQERLRRLRAEQDENRVIDLRWAASGLVITAIGLVLALIAG